MSVFIPIPISELQIEAEQPSKSYRLDMNRKRILPLGTVDGLEAVQQSIAKTLNSPRFRCLIYDDQYGSELKNLIIGADTTPDLIETELPRMVRDALLVDTRIFNVLDFKIEFEDENTYIEFTADTAFGHIYTREMI